jgi:hypothetical protein
MPAAVVVCSNALLLIPSMCMLGSSTARCTEWDGIALPAIAQAFGRRAGRRHDARARVVVPSPPWLAAHSACVAAGASLGPNSGFGNKPSGWVGGWVRAGGLTYLAKAQKIWVTAREHVFLMCYIGRTHREGAQV